MSDAHHNGEISRLTSQLNRLEREVIDYKRRLQAAQVNASYSYNYNGEIFIFQCKKDKHLFRKDEASIQVWRLRVRGAQPMSVPMPMQMPMQVPMQQPQMMPMQMQMPMGMGVGAPMMMSAEGQPNMGMSMGMQAPNGQFNTGM